MNVEWFRESLEDGNVAVQAAFRRGQFDKNQSFTGAVLAWCQCCDFCDEFAFSSAVNYQWLVLVSKFLFCRKFQFLHSLPWSMALWIFLGSISKISCGIVHVLSLWNDLEKIWRVSLQNFRPPSRESYWVTNIKNAHWIKVRI